MQMCISTKLVPNIFLMGFVLKVDRFEVYPTKLVSIMWRMEYNIIAVHRGWISLIEFWNTRYYDYDLTRCETIIALPIISRAVHDWIETGKDMISLVEKCRSMLLVAVFYWLTHIEMSHLLWQWLQEMEIPVYDDKYVQNHLDTYYICINELVILFVVI